MDLKHVKGIGPAKQAKLTDAGVPDVETLARCDVAAVAAATGMQTETVREFKQRALGLTLMQDIKGIGPSTIQTLAQAGIRGLKDLYEASTDMVAQTLETSKEKAQEVRAEAERLYARVQEDVKTSEGRKQLAEDGIHAAKEGAKKLQAATLATIEQLQKDGEAALAKAAELKERAPEMTKELREKGDALLLKAKEIQAKAPEMAQDLKMRGDELKAKAEELAGQAKAKASEVQVKVKAEVEKAKAANEGFLSRIKQRFKKA